jgi:tRNA wybutosine-synthesizing protein 1
MPPEELLQACISAHRKLVSGFKGDERCDPIQWEEARQPRHVACSLTGEPTLYPYLSEFFECCHRMGMTTFLVTNGTMPEVLASMDTLPTQLYVSVCAPNKEIYHKVCCPLVPDAWNRLMDTLRLLPSLDTRKVIRHTLVKNWNLGHEKEYAALDTLAEPWFIEPKGYVHVGHSRERLTMGNMPQHYEIKRFGTNLAGHLGYQLLAERPVSRVVLLGNGQERWL